ncbi:MAG: hypothetical protein OEZ04_05470 [Nitrospinota bacterium]|nr:hypothetical protein [Nitrospinota bacterium]
MKRNMGVAKLSSSLPLALVVAMLASCSGGADSQDANPPPTVNSTPCGPIQELARHKAAWTFYKCEAAANYYITPDSVDPSTGQALGERSMDRAKLSFRYTELHNDKISERENFGAFFKAKGEAGLEVNWQWMSYSIGNEMIQSRLIVQRFDGTCAPRAFCEQAFITNDVQFKDTSEVWQWDCQWSITDTYVICDISKPLDPASPTVRVWNQMLGHYYSLEYIGVGQNAYQGAYPGYNGLVSDLKLTVFE